MFQKWEKTLRYSLIKKLKLQVQLVPKGLIVGQSSVTLMVGFTLQLTKGEQLALFLYGEGEIEGWMGGCTPQKVFNKPYSLSLLPICKKIPSHPPQALDAIYHNRCS